jgi:hypothetical protein
VFVLGKPFELSLRFVGKTGTLLKNLTGALLYGRLLALPTNNKTRLERLASLVYYKKS